MTDREIKEALINVIYHNESEIDRRLKILQASTLTIKELLEELSIKFKYLIFDTEAANRENETLRQLLKDRKDGE